MKEVILQMIDRFDPKTMDEYDTVLKEIIQRLCLLGLWRARFFEHAAFYGGTALRMLYGLDRFSEDLDFSLLFPDAGFSLKPYFESLNRELKGYGFEAEISEKEKADVSPIVTAFIKSNTRMHFIKIGVPDRLSKQVPGNRQLKVKFEVDTDPPPAFETEIKYLLQPVPFSARVFSPPDLFAGKMHAVLCRRWQKRVKGRDWYDMVWFTRQQIPLHIEHLAARMRQTGDLDDQDSLTENDFQNRLIQAINGLDIEAAKKDVAPFLQDPSPMELWSEDFFAAVAGMIQIRASNSSHQY